MSEEKSKAEGELKSKGFLYKTTEFLLGIASVGALILSFIPGANIIGAIIQGGITLVQTGMDLVTKGIKKAALTFATGAAFTAVSFVPFLGGAGKAAKGLSAAGHVANDAAHAGEAVGIFAKITSLFKRITAPIVDGFKWVGNGIGTLLNKIPGFTKGVNYLKGVQASTEKATEAYIKNHRNSGGKDTANALGNEWIKGGTEAGLMATSVGLGMLGGNTTPPNVLANSDLYASNKTDETPDAAWTKRVEAERAARGANTQGVA